MEKREDLKSILNYLPVVLRSSSLFWPPAVVEALKALSRGPDHSKVDSGEVLFLAISDMRHSLNLSGLEINSSTADGFSLFFDDLMSRAEAGRWFGQVLPTLAGLLLRLPSLLEAHYLNADADGLQTGLRMLESQHPGIVLLSQELIGSLLACSFFCLFPDSHRGANLPVINFDRLFASLYVSYNEKQENKLKCIIHYFERICSCMPTGNASFERKVLPLEQGSCCISYPKTNSWSKSMVSLCPFEVCSSGLIEDQSKEAIEVDFANKYLGGGALDRGCVQEEIRFMINPELIAGMLFLPAMADNEAIEIVGAERYSHYTGYASSFRFCGDYVDERDVDYVGRRKTRIVAIDALVNPGWRQYGLDCLQREINKAFCGFLNHRKSQQYQVIFQYEDCAKPQICIGPSNSQTNEDLHKTFVRNFEGHQDDIGIATGNWGCGAFGGDPELKAIIQWLAASQAIRPFILYYTFGLGALQMLEEVTKWILSQGWTVGDLWNMMLEYSSKRLNGDTVVGFFKWLLPSLPGHDPMIMDNTSVP